MILRLHKDAFAVEQKAEGRKHKEKEERFTQTGDFKMIVKIVGAKIFQTRFKQGFAINQCKLPNLRSHLGAQNASRLTRTIVVFET